MPPQPTSLRPEHRVARSGISQLGLDAIPDHLTEIVAALLTGATDVAASQRLNYSPRTYSRRVGELLDFLEVQTRFQAGVRLAAINHWSTPHVNGVDLATLSTAASDSEVRTAAMR